jgi:hypothetical protein
MNLSSSIFNTVRKSTTGDLLGHAGDGDYMVYHDVSFTVRMGRSMVRICRHRSPDEAVLAISFIAIVHMYYGHLQSNVFPSIPSFYRQDVKSSISMVRPRVRRNHGKSKSAEIAVFEKINVAAEMAATNFNERIQ